MALGHYGAFESISLKKGVVLGVAELFNLPLPWDLVE